MVVNNEKDKKLTGFKKLFADVEPQKVEIPDSVVSFRYKFMIFKYFVLGFQFSDALGFHWTGVLDVDCLSGSWEY